MVHEQFEIIHKMICAYGYLSSIVMCVYYILQIALRFEKVERISTLNVAKM